MKKIFLCFLSGLKKNKVQCLELWNNPQHVLEFSINITPTKQQLKKTLLRTGF